MPAVDGTPRSIPKGAVAAGGGGGSALTIQELDGAPSVADVDKVLVNNGSLTDDGGGQVTLDNTGATGAAGADGATGPEASPSLKIYMAGRFR